MELPQSILVRFETLEEAIGNANTQFRVASLQMERAKEYLKELLEEKAELTKAAEVLKAAP